ncbi:MAG: hypothetical protein ACREKH_01320 [Candidatus Rokuibacteriota bacterium]
MIVFHIALQAADDYQTRREAHRRDHIGRLQGLRANNILVGGGPSADGRTADLFYRLQQPAQLKYAIEEDPYWTGGVWTRYEPKSFSQFVEPWEMVPVVLDGTRKVTIVEGPTAQHDMAQFALIEMRGAGRLAFGGFFEDGRTWALTKTADAAEARAWFADTGFWTNDALTTRPFLHVL